MNQSSRKRPHACPDPSGGLDDRRIRVGSVETWVILTLGVKKGGEYLITLIMALQVISLLGLFFMVGAGCDSLPKTVLSNDVEESQGILGIVMIYPGVCLVDAEGGSECLNKPFPGYSTFDIRPYADGPDHGESNPILKTFSSQNDGWFKVELPVGSYCIWSMNLCQAQVDIEPGKWVLITLGVFLP